jgi:hypothetical protein
MGGKKGIRMKRFLILGCALMAMACALMAMGCASTGPVRKVSEVSPMGILSITANGSISWYGQKKSSGLLGNILDKAIDTKLGQSVETIVSVKISHLDW